MYHFNNNQEENENLKNGNGEIVCVQIGVHGLDGSRLFLYDGLNDQAPLIAEVDMFNCDYWLGFDTEFKDGLTYKTTPNAGKFTIVYR